MIGPDEIKNFKLIAEQNEMRAFNEIIDKLICHRRDLNESEISVVRDELQAQSSMIMMIFRFLLQSSEYQFFIRRLKNVVMTKASLRQLHIDDGMRSPVVPL
jgi:hypothetical protein